METFLQTCPSNHILLLDDLDTLYRYADYKFHLKYNRSLLERNKAEEWPIKRNDDFEFYGFFDYDFDKYNIRPLYQDYDDSYTHFSAEEIYGMLSARIISMGYDLTIYRELEQAEYDKAKCRVSKKCVYSHKYGRHALMEFYGWLVLNNRLKCEYDDTFRTAIVDIDPSAPAFRPLRSYFSQSFLSRNINTIDKWLNDESMIDLMVNLSNVKIPNTEGEWVLLKGNFSQKTKNSHSEIYLSRTCFLVPEDLDEKQSLDLSCRESIDHYHAFASELGLCKLEKQEYVNEEDGCITLLAHYSFSSWDSGRFRYPSFYMLNPEIARSIGLVFDVERMNYYLSEEVVSAYYVNGHDHFFFLRKDVLNSILRQFKVKLKCHIYESRMVDDNLPEGAPELSKRFFDREQTYMVSLISHNTEIL